MTHVHVFVMVYGVTMRLWVAYQVGFSGRRTKHAFRWIMN